MSRPNRPKATNKKQKVWYWIKDHRKLSFIPILILLVWAISGVTFSFFQVKNKKPVATITDKEAQEQNIINNSKCPGGVGVLTFELHGDELITKSTCTKDNIMKNASYGGF